MIKETTDKRAKSLPNSIENVYELLGKPFDKRSEGDLLTLGALLNRTELAKVHKMN